MCTSCSPIKMSEILCDNFEQQLPEIITAINKSRFVAIDTEFTALYLQNSDQRSLFDTPEDRYAKLYRTVQHTIPIQIGLSAFSFDPGVNIYQSKTFTFYIWPKPIMSINLLMQIQATSFQFLSQHDFDYNKLIYYGIPFLNRKQHFQVQNDLKEENWPIDCVIEKYLDDIDKNIHTWWMSDNENDDKLIIESLKHKLKYDIDAWYHLQNHLRHNYQDVSKNKRLWTEKSEENDLILTKVTDKKFKELNIKDNLKENTIRSALGHNLLMDLLLLLNTFDELPISYKKFKSKLHNDFPLIYDTKCLSFKVLRKIPKKLEWKRNTLEDLYEYWLDGRGKTMSYNTPLVKTDMVLQNNSYHHAGWDSYCTGFVFVHMAHYIAARQLGIKSHKSRNITSSEHLHAVKMIENQVNLIQASLSHIQIDGPDPKSTRPPWLVAISLENHLDTSQVRLALSTYRHIDIEQITTQKAIIAVSSVNDADEILERFSKRNDFVIRKYNSLLHNKYAHQLFKLSIGMCAFTAVGLFYSMYKRI
ncbi:pre-piRNA 3'-exonuclease trimmer-like [Atheta coriaria]|uniref:pre-piRNA 3'-exonuclease trimmer-like n=1 Tax=Dalotia coriaria TaxID=877792 RepID=UPI0031F346F0